MRALRTTLRLALAIVGALVIVWAVSALGVLAFAERDNARQSDAIVVLGAAQYAGRPSPVLRARLDHAVALWRAEIAPKVIVTGGVGPGDTTSEAAVARKYVEQQGIPADDILLEPGGRTTSESMRAVALILEANGLRRAVLVSDPFHMFRLWLLAHRYGFKAHTSPTRTSPIDPTRDGRWRFVVREAVKAPISVFLDPSR